MTLTVSYAATRVGDIVFWYIHVHVYIEDEKTPGGYVCTGL